MTGIVTVAITRISPGEKNVIAARMKKTNTAN